MHGAQHTERSGARRGAATLVGMPAAYPADDSSLRVQSLIVIICINAPEGCQHDLFAVIKLTPPVVGIPARPEQTRESQARTTDPKRPGIVHSRCVPGAEG